MDDIGAIFSLFIFIMIFRGLLWTLFAYFSNRRKRNRSSDDLEQLESEQTVQISLDEQSAEVNNQQSDQQSELIKDEQCGGYVYKENAYIAVIDGKRHYFCSWDCRQKFIQEG